MNLWFAVAGALGFRVASFQPPDPLFASLLRTFCPTASALSCTPRRYNRLPDLVFTNTLSLPWGSPEYWISWLTPHVFFEGAGDCG